MSASKSPSAKPQIVFFGTGPVSRYCLEGIYDAFEIETIITKPDRWSPDGRLHSHPVREWADPLGIPLHQVADKQALAALFAREHFASSVGLVVDFGMIIPESVIESFELGIINSHFSLLPLLRGADPISFAILEGHEKTGVSLMKIVPALDEGPVIAQQALPLARDVTTPQLTIELGNLSNRLLRDKLPKYIKGDIKPQPQDGSTSPTYTRRLSKSDGQIDWSKPTAQLEREVRAFVGWPGSRTRLLGREVILTLVQVASVDEVKLTDNQIGGSESSKPGTVIEGWPERLFVITGDGALEVLRLKPAGKREMTAAEFMRGRRPAS